jgi:hypothetical protein
MGQYNGSNPTASAQCKAPELIVNSEEFGGYCVRNCYLTAAQQPGAEWSPIVGLL